MTAWAWAWAFALLLPACVAGAFVVMRRKVAAPGSPQAPQAPALASWTDAAGDEFAGMDEAARCELAFALANLDDEQRARDMLEGALDDPSEVVAVAAASALGRLGHAATVERYLSARGGEREVRIAQTLELLWER